MGDARFPIGPSDTFNGVPWTRFCEKCRAELDAYSRHEKTDIKICLACAGLMFEGAGGGSQDITCVPIEIDPIARLIMGDALAKEGAEVNLARSLAPPMPTIDGHVYECVACDEPALPLDPPQFTPDRKRAKRGLCALHGAALEMLVLLREQPTSSIVDEGEGVTFSMCHHCGSVHEDCDVEKTCWGARVRALIARIDAAATR